MLLMALPCYGTNEVTCNITLKVDAGHMDITKSKNSTLSIVNTTPNAAGMSVSVLTNGAGTAIPLGSILTNGIMWCANLGTNLIEIGIQDTSTNFWPLVAVKTNEAWVMRIDKTATPYARATNAATILEYILYDD